MKIIAHVGQNSVLAEMTRDELARLTGVDYASELAPGGQYSRRDGLEIGTLYKVSEIYNRLKYQEWVAGQLDNAAKNLRALADLIETVKPAAELLVATSGVNP